MIKKIISILVLLTMISSVFAYDLSDYPKPFVVNNKLDALIVVGDLAKAQDVIGAVYVATSLQSRLLDQIETAAVLASQVDGEEKNHNLIIVGGPCINAAAAVILNYPEDCQEGFTLGKGKIELFKWSTGKFALLIAGLVAEDTLIASKAVANFNKYDFEGNMIEVSSTKSVKTDLN